MVDDNPQVRQALCEVFKREADFDICGEAENGREAIDQANSLQPDLIVMDFSMPLINSRRSSSVGGLKRAGALTLPRSGTFKIRTRHSFWYQAGNRTTWWVLAGHWDRPRLTRVSGR